MPAVAWMGARDWTVGLVTAASLLASALLAFVLWRKGRTDVASGFGLLALSSVALGLVSSLFGPFILVPSLVATNTMFFAMHADRRLRRVIAAVGVAAVALPFALDLAGLVPAAYSFTSDGTMVVHPRMAYLPGARTLVVLLASSIALVVTPTVLVGRIRDALSAAERRLFAHAWHLRQMVPDEARSNVPSPRASGPSATPRSP
jgi:serine/threonine-protein kinase